MRHLIARIVLAASVVAGIGCGGEAPSGSEAATGGAVISAAEAAKTYALKCGMCHGEDGKLMLAGAPDLSASNLSREDRIALITYGKGTMPPQQGVLDDAAIAAVADHLETLRR